MPIYSAKYSQLKEFYVYKYLRSRKSKFGEIDSPYNIGKGKGKRAFSKQHTIKPPKDKSKIQFISENMNEADAFQLEMLLIHWFGRINKGTGSLRNMTEGGTGCTGTVISAETRKIQSLQRANKMWVNDGNKQLLIRPNLFRQYKQKGYKNGMLKSSVKELVWMHDPKTMKSTMVKISNISSCISKGYILGRPSPSEETRTRISKSTKGKQITQTHKDNIRKSKLGKKRSAEACKRISEGIIAAKKRKL